MNHGFLNIGMGRFCWVSIKVCTCFPVLYFLKISSCCWCCVGAFLTTRQAEEASQSVPTIDCSPVCESTKPTHFFRRAKPFPWISKSNSHCDICVITLVASSVSIQPESHQLRLKEVNRQTSRPKDPGQVYLGLMKILLQNSRSCNDSIYITPKRLFRQFSSVNINQYWRT